MTLQLANIDIYALQLMSAAQLVGERETKIQFGRHVHLCSNRAWVNPGHQKEQAGITHASQ